MNDIVKYIKYNFNEPNVAIKVAMKIRERIKQLEVNPKKYKIVDEIIIKKLKLRMIVIKNYLVFYRVYDYDKTIQIIRILHNKRNWKEIF